MPFTGHAIWCQRPAQPIHPAHEAALRELLTWDVLCPLSTEIVLTDAGLRLRYPPSCLHWSRQFEWPWVLAQADLRPDDVVLEAGCSWSVLKYPLAARCRNVVAVDNDTAALAKVAGTPVFRDHDNIELVAADIAALPFADATFSKVICVSVLEHTADPLRCIDELARVLRPGGLLLLTFDVLMEGPKAEDVVIDAAYMQRIVQRLRVGIAQSGEIVCGVFPDKSVLGAACFRLEKAEGRG